MVKKKFIDKKRSVTYSLVYRSTEDADEAPERTLMEASRGAGATAGGPDVDAAAEAHQASISNRRYPPGHPLAWLEDEERQGEMSDERRKELIELGFPDDGYDYLRHVRTLGRGAGSLEGIAQEAGASTPAGAAGEPPIVIFGGKAPASVRETGPLGPSVFVKSATVLQPEEDVVVFDAARLTVLQPTDVDEEASGNIGGVTAFSRRKDEEALGAERRDIEELEAMMRALEADDDLDSDEGEEEVEKEEERGRDGVRVKGRVLGEGDLLDDFILAATQGGGGADDSDLGEVIYEEGEDDWSSDEDEGEVERSWGGDLNEDHLDGEWAGTGTGTSNGNGKIPPRPRSIASTYWREERHDRKNLLDVIDERFEHLALEYDEDEIGSMEDAAEAGEIQGVADVAEFDNLLNEFLEERRNAGFGGPLEKEEEEEEQGSEGSAGEEERKRKPVGGRRRGESILRAKLEAAGFDDAHAEVAIEAARAAIRRMEKEEAEGRGEVADLEAVPREVDPTAGWDCETILTLRSNLYNHPGTITEPGRASRGPPAGMIRLNKAGIPIGVIPRKYNSASGADEELEGNNGRAVRMKPAAVVVERKKGESAEEKRARKTAVKEAKRDARVAKKDLKTLYKDETMKAHRRAATAQVQPTVIL